METPVHEGSLCTQVHAFREEKLAYLKSLVVPLMVKVEVLVPPDDVGHLWREHVMLHKPVSHVVIFPAPPPEVQAIAVDCLELFSGENADTSKEVLHSMH